MHDISEYLIQHCKIHSIIEHLCWNDEYTDYAHIIHVEGKHVEIYLFRLFYNTNEKYQIGLFGAYVDRDAQFDDKLAEKMINLAHGYSIGAGDKNPNWLIIEELINKPKRQIDLD